jgi:hypothetical protein
LALSLAFFFPILPVSATDTEHREYSILIDGKSSGTSKMSIVQQDDGSLYTTGSVDVRFRKLLGEYTLKIESQEWWKKGRLIGMKTSTQENSKKTEVTVAQDNDQLRIRINGADRNLNPDVWPTSFWKLADARFHNKQVPVLESDTGKEFMGELKFVKDEKLDVAGDLTECFHFRVTGGPSPVDLWFDRYHRLVRQEFTELGHKTIVQLTRVRR